MPSAQHSLCHYLTLLSSSASQYTFGMQRACGEILRINKRLYSLVRLFLAPRIIRGILPTKLMLYLPTILYADRTPRLRSQLTISPGLFYFISNGALLGNVTTLHENSRIGGPHPGRQLGASWSKTNHNLH